MTNELLEQWRKEAENLYLNSEIVDNSYPDWRKINTLYRNKVINRYIEGCKATHEKMQNEVDRLKYLIKEAHLKGWLNSSMTAYRTVFVSWDDFKQTHNL